MILTLIGFTTSRHRIIDSWTDVAWMLASTSMASTINTYNTCVTSIEKSLKPKSRLYRTVKFIMQMMDPSPIASVSFDYYNTACSPYMLMVSVG